jgi:hypothetical protein
MVLLHQELKTSLSKMLTSGTLMLQLRTTASPTIIAWQLLDHAHTAIIQLQLILEQELLHFKTFLLAIQLLE